MVYPLPMNPTHPTSNTQIILPVPRSCDCYNVICEGDCFSCLTCVGCGEKVECLEPDSSDSSGLKVKVELQDRHTAIVTWKDSQGKCPKVMMVNTDSITEIASRTR